MYVVLFLLYVILSSAVTLWLFVWAIRRGQFKDQQRARYLPLVKEEQHGGPVPMAHFSGSPAVGLFGLILATLLAVAVVMFYSFVRGD
ncbi:MAG TPA: cbb3-type cytochrome oxidase assembly protein CcoS [Syntrophobacteria bacterium]|nr:cbb3-type cytochrome oxidase assembly protein CcoS [Syntrophobacteria bacterium]